MYFSSWYTFTSCRRKTKRILQAFIMMLVTSLWIFVLLFWTVLSISIVDKSKFVQHDKNVLDYTLIGGTVNEVVGTGGEEDERHFQRDIDNVDVHYALYHPDNSDIKMNAYNMVPGARKVLNDYNDKNIVTVLTNKQQQNQQNKGKIESTKSIISVINSSSSTSSNSISYDNTFINNSANIDDDAKVKHASNAPFLNDDNIAKSTRQIGPQGPTKHNGQFKNQAPSSFATQQQSNTPENNEQFNHEQNESSSDSIKQRLPKAIIIGVKKAGTRALLEFLKMHPDVKAPGPEPHFFDKNYDKGYDWYRNQMPMSEDHQLTIEKTPSYFITKESPARIFNMSKDTKLIVVVRDPVTRAISDYTQGLERRPDLKKTFEQMAFLDNNTKIVNISWTPIKIGMYIRHLERWLKYFPLKQIHFVDGEKLISQPAHELYKVQQFLAIRTVINDTYFSFNKTKGFPCLVKQPSNSKLKPHCLGETKGRQHPKVSDKAFYKLKEFYTPFNQKLYILLKQNFGW